MVKFNQSKGAFMGKLESIGVETGKGKYYEEAIYSLALIYNVITDEMTTYLDDFALTPGKFNILLAVKQDGQEGISQVEVSKRIIVTPSNMTKLIDKLQTDGLVTRSALEGDRRVNILKITTKGVKLLDSVWEGYNSRLKNLIASLNNNEQKAVSSLLVKWLENLRG